MLAFKVRAVPVRGKRGDAGPVTLVCVSARDEPEVKSDQDSPSRHPF